MPTADMVLGWLGYLVAACFALLLITTVTGLILRSVVDGYAMFKRSDLYKDFHKDNNHD